MEAINGPYEFLCPFFYIRLVCVRLTNFGVRLTYRSTGFSWLPDAVVPFSFSYPAFESFRACRFGGLPQTCCFFGNSVNFAFVNVSESVQF